MKRSVEIWHLRTPAAEPLQTGLILPDLHAPVIRKVSLKKAFSILTQSVLTEDENSMKFRCLAGTVSRPALE
jgi:hypothetical protein